MQDQPLLIRRVDVPGVYGFSERMLKRWVLDGRLSHVHPAGGPKSPCFLLREELNDLVARSTTRKKRNKKRA